MLLKFNKFKHWFMGTMIAITLVGSCDASKKMFIAVTQITSHSALDAVREGLQDSLIKYSLQNDVELVWVYENAQGNIATATQIAQKFAGLEPDVIVALSTPSAQSVISSTRHSDIPVVFAAVTDPVAAKLVQSLEKPGGRITGTYDFPPIADQIDLLKELVPSVSKVGILFNPGEVNSVRQLEVFKAEAEARNLQVIEGPCLKSIEVIPTAQRLIGQVDAVYIPQDNMVVSSLPGLSRVMVRHNIPLIVPDPEGVKAGGLATIGFSHMDEGRACAEVVLRIINGEDPATIPVQQPKNKKVYINKKVLAELGLELPERLKDKKEAKAS